MIVLSSILMAEEIIENSENNFTIINMFDKYVVDRIPTKMEKSYMLIKVIGSVKDNEKMMSLKIMRHDIQTKNLSIQYKHSDSRATYYLIEFTSFPVVSQEIIHFELHYQNKMIGKTEIAFVLKEGDENNE